jgi:hypothetical protein
MVVVAAETEVHMVGVIHPCGYTPHGTPSEKGSRWLGR